MYFNGNFVLKGDIDENAYMPISSIKSEESLYVMM